VASDDARQLHVLRAGLGVRDELLGEIDRVAFLGVARALPIDVAVVAVHRHGDVAPLEVRWRSKVDDGEVAAAFDDPRGHLIGSHRPVHPGHVVEPRMGRMAPGGQRGHGNGGGEQPPRRRGLVRW